MGLATLGALVLAGGALPPALMLALGTAVAGVAYGGALVLRAPELIDLLGAVQRRRAPVPPKE